MIYTCARLVLSVILLSIVTTCLQAQNYFSKIWEVDGIGPDVSNSIMESLVVDDTLYYLAFHRCVEVATIRPTIVAEWSAKWTWTATSYRNVTLVDTTVKPEAIP